MASKLSRWRRRAYNLRLRQQEMNWEHRQFLTGFGNQPIVRESLQRIVDILNSPPQPKGWRYKY